jgi:hypothetical protein
MLSFSEFVIYGAAEAFLALLLLVLGLTVYNLRLRGRIKLLDSWLVQLKDKTRGLLEEAKRSAAADNNAANAAKPSPGLQASWATLAAAAHPILADTGLPRDDLVGALNGLGAELGLTPMSVPPCANSKAPKVEAAQDSAGAPPGSLEAWANPTEEATKNQPQAPADLGKLKDASAQQKELIQRLLQQNSDAESEISVKASELQKLQQFHRESEVCIRLLEDELNAAHDELDAMRVQVKENKEMKTLIRRFTQESSEMLTCIETLEQEIATLNAALAKHK